MGLGAVYTRTQKSQFYALYRKIYFHFGFAYFILQKISNSLQSTAAGHLVQLLATGLDFQEKCKKGKI